MPALSKAECDHEKKSVLVMWSESSQADPYPYVWLRDNCLCSECFHSSAQVRRLLIRNLDPDIQPASVQVKEDGKTLTVTWENGHQGEYKADWLHYRSFSVEGQRKRREIEFQSEKRNLWTKGFTPQYFQFDEVMKNDETLLSWLTSVHENGLAIIENSGLEPGTLVKLVDRFAFLKKTCYGETFQLKVKIDPSALGFGPDELGLHTDMPCLYYSPQVQFLHCQKQSAEGGRSTFSDGYKAAERLKENNPRAFEILTTTKVDYWDIGVDFRPFHLCTRRNVIEVDAAGNCSGVYYTNMLRNSALNAPVEKVRDIYAALIAFDKELYNEDNLIRPKLKEGDIAAFDNRRLVHGRRGFDPAKGGERHLEGGYLNWDDAYSCMRVLKTKLNKWKESHHFTTK